MPTLILWLMVWAPIQWIAPDGHGMYLEKECTTHMHGTFRCISEDAEDWIEIALKINLGKQRDQPPSWPLAAALAAVLAFDGAELTLRSRLCVLEARPFSAPAAQFCDSSRHRICWEL